MKLIADAGFRAVVGLFAGAELAAAILAFTRGSWFDGAVYLGFGVMFALFGYLRIAWIRLGFRRGRAETLWAADEAARRGLSPQQWVLSELERDMGGTLVPRRREPP